MAQTSGPLSPDGQWRWTGYLWEPVAPRTTSRLAIASLVLALAVPLWPISSIAAIACGWRALVDMRRSPELAGRGLAISGIVGGTVVLVLFALFIVAILWLNHVCRNGC